MFIYNGCEDLIQLQKLLLIEYSIPHAIELFANEMKLVKFNIRTKENNDDLKVNQVKKRKFTIKLMIN